MPSLESLSSGFYVYREQDKVRRWAGWSDNRGDNPAATSDMEAWCTGWYTDKKKACKFKLLRCMTGEPFFVTDKPVGPDQKQRLEDENESEYW